MNISKTTTNFAKTRGLSVYIDEDTFILWIGAESENIGEDICCYIANDNGTFTWKGNIGCHATQKKNCQRQSVMKNILEKLLISSLKMQQLFKNWQLKQRMPRHGA